jgi:hypothetical protein
MYPQTNVAALKYMMMMMIDDLSLLFVIWLSVNALNCNARELVLLFRSAGPGFFFDNISRPGLGRPFFRRKSRAGPARPVNITGLQCLEKENIILMFTELKKTYVFCRIRYYSTYLLSNFGQPAFLRQASMR